MRNTMLATVLLLASACSLDEGEMQGESPEALADLPSYPDGADIEACESFIRGGLESPGSYKRLSLTRRDTPITVDAYAALLGELGSIQAIRDNIELKAERGLQLREVTIESVGDAFEGPRTRRTDTCRFVLYGGKIPLSEALADRVASASSRREFRQMAADGLVPGVDAENLKPSYQVGCCLPHA